MKHLFIIIAICLISAQSMAQQMPTPFEKDPNSTPTYHEVIAYYKMMADYSANIHIEEWGTTDAGFPLHTVIYSADGDFNMEKIKEADRRILFINNSIHPGEPCGIDATMMLFRDLMFDAEAQALATNTVIVTVPIYNIGGTLNRSSYSRANQNGPKAYGFRGNARNLDLNRDFIKADSKNAQTFNQIFTHWDPDVFVDTHTSNGADYQYVMTIIASQKDKVTPPLSKYMYETFVPDLYTEMAGTGYDMTPYVNVRDTPDNGIYDFLDSPRYSTGYANLHNAISFMPEAHMLKPYEDRVKATLALLESVVTLIKRDKDKIALARQEAKEYVSNATQMPINWKMDRTKSTPFKFKGYEAKYKKSEVSGKDRLWYDHNSPWEREIPFYNYYEPSTVVDVPKAYSEVIERLKWNGVKMYQLAKDQIVNAEFYYIEDFKSRDKYEGHYLYHSVEVRKETMPWQYYAGDYVIYPNQEVNRYIVETLEPQAADSYFAWNFFDGILNQKEYFSSYVFEDLAAQYLKDDPALKAALEKKKSEDPKFAESAYQQLSFIYKRSPHYEPTHKLYPVGRIMGSAVLSVK